MEILNRMYFYDSFFSIFTTKNVMKIYILNLNPHQKLITGEFRKILIIVGFILDFILKIGVDLNFWRLIVF